MNGSKMDAFIEIGFTNEQVEATIAAEERLGLRDRKCAFLDDFVPEQAIRTRCDALAAVAQTGCATNKPPSKISAAERAKRLAASNFARGSVRLEGFIVSPECEALQSQYVDGEITAEEVILGLNKLYKKEPQK